MQPIYLIAIVFGLITLVFFIREIFRHVTRQERCPVCGNQHPDRARRPAWAKSMQFMITSQGFHCHACGNQFIRIGQLDRRPAEPAPMHEQNIH